MPITPPATRSARPATTSALAAAVPMHVSRPRLVALVVATACAALALPIAAAEAHEPARPGVHVVTRDASPGPAGERQVRQVRVYPRRDSSALIVRRVVEPAAVVPRELADQPTFAHLAEVRVGNQRILVDPKLDDLRRLHPDHEIRRAVRMFRTQPPGGVTVIRSLHADGAAHEPAQGRRIVPRAVIYRPDALGPAPQPRPKGLPEVHDEESGDEQRPAPRQIRPAPKGQLKLVMHD